MEAACSHLELAMTVSPRLPTEVRTKFGVGAALIVAGLLWIFVILFLVTPDQIVPTKEDVRIAYEGFLETANAPLSLWTLNTGILVLAQASVLIFLDVLFVFTRYGGVPLLFLGGYLIMDGISSLRGVRR